MRASIAALAVLLLAGCGGGRERPEASLARVGLDPLAGCEELTRALRERAVADMERTLAANLEAALRGGCWGHGWEYDGGPVPAAPATGAPGGAGARVWSDTNAQVPGVDEPDLVETDGELVFAIADGRVQVLDAWPPAEARRIAALPLEGTPKGLLLHGTRLVVLSSVPPPGGGTDPGAPAAVPWPGDGGCTYGYDCVPAGDGMGSRITVLDVADPAAPRTLREVTFDGSYLAARRIGESVHAVVALPERTVPGLEWWPAALACGGEAAPWAIRDAFERLRVENRRRIAEADLGGWAPSARDVRHAPGGAVVEDEVLGGCPGFYASAEGEGAGFVSIASLSTAGDGPLSVATALGRPGFVHAAEDALYVASSHAWRGGAWFWAAPAASAEATTVHAFRLADSPSPRAEYAGSGLVEGRVLSSFSLDAHEGALRVATTTGHLPDPATRSGVTVLRDAGGRLEEVGRVDGIAPGEDLRAVRFDGARGFLVTFEKTDPLFVLDLADPTAPAVAGELVVPGFSTYLHLMDPDHLLTVGYDAADQGGFAWFTGFQLQVFDVADPAAPSLAHREIIGTRGSTSAAATDHLAFNYFAPRSLLALPMVICEGGDASGGYGSRMTFSGLLVYRVRADEGFTYLGGVAHASPGELADQGYGCWSWWADPRTEVKRSVFLEDWVLSFTDRELRIQDTRALGIDVARVDLTAP